MKKQIVFLLFIIHFISSSIVAQVRINTNFLDSIAYPIDTTFYVKRDFIPNALFANANIIGLGEATHGTKEFYVIKDYIFRNQVLFNNVRAFAIESDFCGMVRFNNYLLDNSKTIQSLPQEFDSSGIYSIYYTKELYDLFEWIKSYNLKQINNSDKIKVYGIDMQDPFSISKYIIENYPSLKQEDSLAYLELKNINNLYYPRREIKLKKKDIDKYIQLSDKLALLIKQNDEKKGDEILVRCIELLKQTFGLRYNNNQINQKKSFEPYSNARDKYMADNCIWIYQQISQQKTNDSGKLIVWAHNGHVGFDSDNDINDINGIPMGYFISRKDNIKYCSLGFSFGEGEVRMFDFDGPVRKFRPFLYNPSQKKNSIEYWLKDVKYPVFIIPFNQPNSPEIENFFSINKYQRMIGAKHQGNEDKDYISNPVNKSFNGIIFVRKGNSAESMN